MHWTFIYTVVFAINIPFPLICLCFCRKKGDVTPAVSAHLVTPVHSVESADQPYTWGCQKLGELMIGLKKILFKVLYMNITYLSYKL